MTHLGGDDHVVRLRDGRSLGFAQYGCADGVVVVNAHGGLVGRLDVSAARPVADQVGIRLISPDRPGIGLSDRLPGRTLLDWADDIVELVDHLGVDRFSAMGWSMGGQYAAALGYAMPSRVRRVAISRGRLAPDRIGGICAVTAVRSRVHPAVAAGAVGCAAVLSDDGVDGALSSDTQRSTGRVGPGRGGRGGAASRGRRHLLRCLVRGTAARFGRHRRLPGLGAAVGVRARGHRRAGRHLVGNRRPARALVLGRRTGAADSRMRLTTVVRVVISWPTCTSQNSSRRSLGDVTRDGIGVRRQRLVNIGGAAAQRLPALRYPAAGRRRHRQRYRGADVQRRHGCLQRLGRAVHLPRTGLRASPQTRSANPQHQDK